MTSKNDLPVLTGDDWLDLGDGEQGIVMGRLDGPLRRGQEHATIVDAAWRLLLVGIPEGYGSHDLPSGRKVRILVTRVEDGVEAGPRDVIEQAAA